MSAYIVFVVSFLVALGVSGLCSLAESVLLSLSTPQIAEIAQKNPRIGAIWQEFKGNINEPITSILAVNTAAHTIGASVAGAAFAEIFGDKWLALFSLIFTFLMLQYTEILPKTLGVRFNRRFAFVVARPLWFATKFGKPVIRAIRFFNKPFEPRAKKGETTEPGVAQEIMFLAALARADKQLDKEQETIIAAALKLSKTTAEEAMAPYDEASTLTDCMSLDRALDAALADSHTRFPVCRGVDRSAVVGYVNVKELAANYRELKANGELATTAKKTSEETTARDANANRTDEEGANVRTGLSDSIRPIMRVETSTKVSDALNAFVRKHEHIALVVDEDGTPRGVLTLEDVVEELVGEIEDEFDRLQSNVRRTPRGLIVGGGAYLATVAAAVKERFPNDDAEFLAEVDALTKTTALENAPTLNAWIKSQTPGNVLRNLRIVCGGLSFVVRRARRGDVFDAAIEPAVLGRNDRND